MRIIVILVLLWMPVGDFGGAESASPAAEPALLGIAAGYPDDEGIRKDSAAIRDAPETPTLHEHQ